MSNYSDDVPNDAWDDREAELEKQLTAATAKVEKLREGLRKLANEASGFMSMADPADHGVSNMNILNMRINEARALLLEGK